MSWAGRRAVDEAARGRLGCAGWVGVLLIPVPTIACWWLVFGGTADGEALSPPLRLLGLGAALMFTAVWLMIAATPLKVGGRFARALAVMVNVGLFGGVALFALGGVWVMVQRFVDGEGELGGNITMSVIVLFLLAVPFIFLFSRYIPGTGGYQPPAERRAARRRRVDGQ